jgi:hypothetical protein
LVGVRAVRPEAEGDREEHRARRHDRHALRVKVGGEDAGTDWIGALGGKSVRPEVHGDDREVVKSGLCWDEAPNGSQDQNGS